MSVTIGHDGWCESEFGASWWKAVCSCGFESPPVTSEEAASAALSGHYAAPELDRDEEGA